MAWPHSQKVAGHKKDGGGGNGHAPGSGAANFFCSWCFRRA
jgi:hypothetical protein